MALKIDARLFIEERGGVSEYSRFLTGKGFPVTRQGVSKWGREGLIPMRAWLRIMSIEGKSLDIRNYIVREK